MGCFGTRISDTPLHAVRSSGARAWIGSVALGSDAGNIARRRRSVRGENGRKRQEILPAYLAGIVNWRGFPGDDRTDC